MSTMSEDEGCTELPIYNRMVTFEISGAGTVLNTLVAVPCHILNNK